MWFGHHFQYKYSLTFLKKNKANFWDRRSRCTIFSSSRITSREQVLKESGQLRADGEAARFTAFVCSCGSYGLDADEVAGLGPLPQGLDGLQFAAMEGETGPGGQLEQGTGDRHEHQHVETAQAERRGS